MYIQNLKLFEEINQLNNNFNKSQALYSIGQSSIQTIDSAISALSNLMNNLEIYKSTILDCLILEAENADSGREYDYSEYSQSHTLPGIVSIPQLYSFNDIKSESEKLEQLNTVKEKALNQKRLYLRFILKDANLLNQTLKGIEQNDCAFEEAIEILNGNINLHLQPSPLSDSPSKKEPSIKLSLSREFYNGYKKKK